MTSILDWSPVSTTNYAANATVDTGIAMTENSTNISAFNNAVRQMMGRMAQYIADQAGVVTVGGTADVITITTSGTAYTTLTNNASIMFFPSGDNTGAVTLAVNGGAAKAIKKIVSGSATALAAGNLAQGVPTRIIWNTSADAWLMSVPVVPTLTSLGATKEIIIACSDETTALTTGTAKVTFRMPFALTLTAVRASVTTAPTGSVLTVDINEGGSTVLSTKLTIDAGEKTSTTAATPAVISDSSLASDAEITIDIDGVGSTIAGAGLKVTLIGTI